MDRRLGRAAQSGEPHSGGAGTQCPDQVGPHPVPAGEHHPQRTEVAGDLGEHLQPAGKEVDHRYLVSGDQPCPAVRIAPLVLVDHDDGAAGAQDAEHIGYRHVRFQVRERQFPVLGPDLEVPVEKFQGVEHRVVGQFHTLGLAGGTGGEQHIGQVARCHRDGFEWCHGSADIDHASERDTGGGQHVGNVVATDERECHPCGSQHACSPVDGLIDTDRQVGRPGGEYAEQRGDLLGAFGSQHGDDIAGADTAGLQRAGHRKHSFFQFTVGQRVGARDQRGGRGSGLGVAEEAVHQVLTAGGRGRGVDGVADGAGVRRQRGRVRFIPGRVALGQPGQFGDLVGEHRLRYPGREGLHADVPVDHQSVGQRCGLGVDEHLRALGDGPHRLTELVGDVAGEQVPQPQRAGVDDGGQGLGTAVPAHIAQHVQAGHRRVRGGGVQDVLHRLRSGGRRTGAGQVDVEHQRGGEAAHQFVDVGMIGLATEHRQVEQEACVAGPAGQRVGVRRGHGHRRCDAPAMCRGEQRITGRYVEDVP